MPPSLPRPTICRASSLATATRCFTTSASRALPAAIPPESPKFIKVPEPPQSSEPRLPYVKGHLPVPREIFDKREGSVKVEPGYVDRISPRSVAELSGLPPKNEHEARRRQMAESRRQSLAAGLKGLWERKQKKDTALARRTQANYLRNKRAAMAPEPLDEFLTRPTVRSSTANVTTVDANSDRFEQAEAARQEAERLAALKSEARRDALAQLYVAAGDFVITESELEEKIDKEFKKDSHAFGRVDGGQSMWDMQRAPISVGQMQAELAGKSENLFVSGKSGSTKTAARQKIVAEELTGGKLI
ncbi:hypothetical protein QBC46DRAFT_372301 [Diplogelasinospora grovesii]|uniref:Uncharacterized protein n=1 Tax=Diplogelasinospora grovesii TaxID=303347 RepID=A0AAN6NIM1_9PEZI|nr:hypothetical protein QBC46DRAFT_372301 [Diplogelasinospora grovesii]